MLHRFLPLFAALAVASCQMSLPDVVRQVVERPTGPAAVELLAGEVNIVAPEGFCADLKSSRPEEESPTLYFASCSSSGPKAALSAVAAPEPTPGILIGVDPQTLADFFGSERGKTLLSRTGDPSSITIHSIEVVDSVVILNLSDSSRASLPGIAAGYWRALAEINGHLVTLAVLGFENRPLPEVAKRGLLEMFIDRTLLANPASAEEESQG